jgi:hypothetical protein
MQARMEAERREVEEHFEWELAEARKRQREESEFEDFYGYTNPWSH